MSDKFGPNEQPILILFAKAPKPGEVKTRLMPHCSAEQAAAVAAWLIDQTLNLVCAAWRGQVVLSVAGDVSNSKILALSQKYDVDIVSQPMGDLGQRMRLSIEHFGYPAAVMGCDAPHCSSDTLIQAQSQLQRGESVIAPSDDGGYYLLGLVHPMDELFNAIPWGTHRVYELTQQSARENGYALSPLRELRDIDHWEDLYELAQQRPDFKLSLQRLGLNFDS